MSIQGHETSTQIPNLLDLLAEAHVSAAASGLGPSTGDDTPDVDNLGPSTGIDQGKPIMGFWPSVGDDGVPE